tara:strand:+ start:62 stop:1015 length:954 start_codon:yes stop_codon:yes gene_type:complete
MKIEPLQVSKVIQQNFSHLMTDFYEMQTEYMASLNFIYEDLDASLVAMVITNDIYKNVYQNGKHQNTSIKFFYEADHFSTPISSLKIKDISSRINLPRETVRRKKEKLIKDKLIYVDYKKKTYSLNTAKIDKKVIELQMNNISKFLHKFSQFFIKNKFYIKDIKREQIKQDLDKKFLIYLTKFLDFQISYFSNLKSFVDIESIFITLLVSLNTLSQKNKLKPLNYKDLFYRIHELNTSHGLNATSISEITKIPRTTVLRKIANLEKIGLIKKDKFKRYGSGDVGNGEVSNKMYPAVEHNIKILGVFFAECLETYSSR